MPLQGSWWGIPAILGCIPASFIRHHWLSGSVAFWLPRAVPARRRYCAQAAPKHGCSLVVVSRQVRTPSLKGGLQRLKKQSVLAHWHLLALALEGRRCESTWTPRVYLFFFPCPPPQQAQTRCAGSPEAQTRVRESSIIEEGACIDGLLGRSIIPHLVYQTQSKRASSRFCFCFCFCPFPSRVSLASARIDSLGTSPARPITPLLGAGTRFHSRLGELFVSCLLEIWFLDSTSRTSQNNNHLDVLLDPYKYISIQLAYPQERYVSACYKQGGPRESTVTELECFVLDGPGHGLFRNYPAMACTYPLSRLAPIPPGSRSLYYLLHSLSLHLPPRVPLLSTKTIPTVPN